MATTLETHLSPSLIEIRTKSPGRARNVLIDAAGLEADLRARIRGEVRFSDGDRGMWASDAGNYRMVPIGVVLPMDADDVTEVVAVCSRYGAPIVARGGGTGIPGQTVNVAVVLDFSKYMRHILEMDPKTKSARVEPGLVLDSLREEAKKHDLTFGPDPATHSRCTLGGMIGNNSCGIHSVMAGETSDNIEELEVLTYDGTRMRAGATSDEQFREIVQAGGRRAEIYSRLRDLRDRHADAIRRAFPNIPRRVSGYNLPALLPEKGFHIARALVGSEGTCVVVLEARTRLVYSRPARSLLVLGYPDIFTAADHVNEPLAFDPVGLEALDDTFIRDMKKKGVHPPHMELMPEGRAWLLVEFGGKDEDEADAAARRLMDDLRRRGDAPPMKLFDDPRQEKLVWNLREEGLGATARVPGDPDNHEGWEDSSVPPEKTGAYLRRLRKLMDKYGYEGALYGHFGQGCVHTRLTFDLETARGIENFRQFLGEAADLVVSMGGSLSGEHGDGQARGELLPRMFDPEIMDAFREFKSIWDPDWKMNPGKVVEPYRVDENLRLGVHYNPPEPETHFAWPDDRHSFTYATERCVGAGVCRRLSGGTMCPSYMVTLEEKHSTRGRARILNEMIRGEVIKDGWKSEEVFEALDLCLSCKGCKGDCPVQVDMASYKAEFLSHYYEDRLRPRTAYTMGLIHRWAHLAAFAPGVANFLTHTPGLRVLSKLAAGVHSSREIPRFAPYTFQQWSHWRRARNGRPNGQPRVMLFPDTFNNHFHPRIAQAATGVLESAGFDVRIPRGNFCCGRPLYDWGMLDAAKRLLQRFLNTFAQPIEEGIPMVVLEPSCASVFREEMVNLLPNDENARRLKSQTFLLSEFLDKWVPNFQWPKLERKAVVHGHCHHKAIFGMDADEKALKQMGVDFELLNSGCCGMAGAFGFEDEHYDIAMKCGERALLPAVRRAPKDAIVITDGFSCHEQVRQATGREPLHLAQVIEMATREGPHGPAGEYPEKDYVRHERFRPRWRRPALLAAGAAIAGSAVWWARRRKTS